jgi:hypothetical protein
MKHPSPDDLLDAMDGAASHGVAVHLAACATCRRRSDDLLEMQRAIWEVGIPEPSPLFWSEFAASVHEATQAAQRPERGWLPPSWLTTRWRWSLAAAAVFIVGIAGSAILRHVGELHVQPTGPATGSLAEVFLADSADDEAPWVLLDDVADDLDWEGVSAAGLGPLPGTADRAVSQLSGGERAELAKLLAREIASPAL